MYLLTQGDSSVLIQFGCGAIYYLMLLLLLSLLLNRDVYYKISKIGVKVKNLGSVNKKVILLLKYFRKDAVRGMKCHGR